MAKVTKSDKVNSQIDMRLTKNDILELLITEEQNKLKSQYERLEQDYVNYRNKIKAETYDEFVRDNGQLVSDMKRLFGEHVKIEFSYAYDTVQVAFSDRGAKDSNAAWLPLKVSDVRKDALDALRKVSDDKQREIRDFNNNIKDFKVKLTRQILEGSEEGQAILGSLKQITMTLPAPKSK